MVKLDAGMVRYLSHDDFRVLTAIEMGTQMMMVMMMLGMKNHEMVPTSLICVIAGIKSGVVHNSIKILHKNKLVWHTSAPCM